MALVLKGQKVADGREIIVARPDGARKRIRPYPVVLYDGIHLAGAINTLVDITAQKEMEDKQHKLLGDIKELSTSKMNLLPVPGMS